MYKHKNSLNALITAVTNDLSFCCVEQIDQVATFGVGHFTEPPADAYGDHGQVVARGYLDLDFQDIQGLLYDGYVTGVNVVDGQLEGSRMHLTDKAIKSYVLGDFFKGCDPDLEAVCFDLMVQARWDTAIREAMLLIETRLRKLGNSTNWGIDLVNECFGSKGTLACRFKSDSERQGFRDLFAGAMGVIRNDYAHNFRTPSKHETTSAIRFADMLLKKLDTLM